jgi:molybdate transport system substrate-binding protein
LSTALKEIGDSFEAPFDLFFSADMDYPRQLIAADAADAASLYQYAVGELVLWVPADSPLDVERQGMNVLLDPSVKKIAPTRSMLPMAARP